MRTITLAVISILILIGSVAAAVSVQRSFNFGLHSGVPDLKLCVDSLCTTPLPSFFNITAAIFENITIPFYVKNVGLFNLRLNMTHSLFPSGLLTSWSREGYALPVGSSIQSNVYLMATTNLTVTGTIFINGARI